MACYLFKEENGKEIDNGHKGHLCSLCANSKGIGLGCGLCMSTKSCHFIKKDKVDGINFKTKEDLFGKYIHKLCPNCDKEMITKEVTYFYNNTYLGTFPAEVCEKCNEIYFSDEVFAEIEERAKIMKIWRVRSEKNNR
jgi:YgiT-type zinc finger domain-containing protein